MSRCVLSGFVLLVAFAAAASCAAEANAAPPTVGQPAPDFTATDADGKQVKLSSFRGGNVVVVFTRAHW